MSGISCILSENESGGVDNAIDTEQGEDRPMRELYNVLTVVLTNTHVTHDSSISKARFLLNPPMSAMKGGSSSVIGCGELVNDLNPSVGKSSRKSILCLHYAGPRMCICKQNKVNCRFVFCWCGGFRFTWIQSGQSML